MIRSFYSEYGKRWFDVVLALLGLLLLSPLLLMAAIAVKLDSPGSLFFLQERTGRYGKPFRIIKFRTMKQADCPDATLITASGDARITRVGRLLRKTKVDELPQLFNVLFGEMSLVGPRPEVPKYTRLYSNDQKRIFLERPGITSPAALACVNEEETLSAQNDPEDFYVHVLMPKKLKLDLSYCRDISALRDGWLICGTLMHLLTSRKLENQEKRKLAAHTEEAT